jgi:hypothetical protein
VRTARAICVLLALSFAAGCGSGGAFELPSGVVYPSIEPDSSASEPHQVSRTFTFEGRDRVVTLTVDGPLYAGASAAQKSVIRFGNARENDWIEDYYPAFVWEEHQDAFFAGLLAQLRAIRDSDGLDADRYAELLVVFAQSLEYRTDAVDLSPKFPVETVVEAAGDCDDKSLLLAGLLAREGFDVAIMLFEPEQHVALGIRSDELDYEETGYAYVETTSGGFIGMVPDTLAGDIELTSRPRVFPIGGGTRAYGSGAQVAAILEGLATAQEQLTSIGAEVRAADARLEQLEPQVKAEAARLESLRSAGMTAEYNAAVPGYNAMVETYNAAIAERNATADEHNRWGDLERAIIEHTHDRPGVYARVTAGI